MGKRMARHSKPLTLNRYAVCRACWPGILSIVLLFLFIGGSFSALFMVASNDELIIALDESVYLRNVVSFTLFQATLSTLISVGIGIFVARAFARRQSFKGRKLILQFLGLPIVTPVIIAALGITAIYGQNGILRNTLDHLGFSWSGSIYGLSGILIAHVFFNLPLSIRMLLPVWDRIPSESWRLAAQIGMNSSQIFFWLEWPALTKSLAGTIGVVFLLCFSSFAVVLILGGGPSSTTIEVAIYEALRFDFDLPKAATLAIVQLLICTIILISLHRWMRMQTISYGLKKTCQYRSDLNQKGSLSIDLSLISLTILFVALPLIAIIYKGLKGPLTQVILNPDLWAAAGRSLGIAVFASTIALLLAVALIITSRHLLFRYKLNSLSSSVQIMGSMTLAAPPMVIGTGLFILLLPLGIAFDSAIFVIIFVNAILLLPYMMRTIGPAIMDAGYRYEILCWQLDLRGINRLKIVDWPLIRQPLGFAMAFCATLSFGDLGVAALFDTSGTITLPVLLYHQLGNYRFNEAASTALVLMFLCATTFFIVDRGIRKWRT